MLGRLNANFLREDAAQVVSDQLVSARRWGDITYINLPIILPSGSAATVRVFPSIGGFRVDDGGYAYRELESVGAERRFSATARRIAEPLGLAVNSRTIGTEVREDGLFVAVCDVGIASRDTVERVFARIGDASDDEIEEQLRKRLLHVFGPGSVEDEQRIAGSSTNDWKMSAIVRAGAGLIVFQAVAEKADSVWRASAAFEDLALLENPPGRVAVVKDKAALGAKLSILSRHGRVIQENQSDDTFLRAAA